MCVLQTRIYHKQVSGDPRWMQIEISFLLQLPLIEQSTCNNITIHPQHFSREKELLVQTQTFILVTTTFVRAVCIHIVYVSLHAKRTST